MNFIGKQLTIIVSLNIISTGNCKLMAKNLNVVSKVIITIFSVINNLFIYFVMSDL